MTQFDFNRNFKDFRQNISISGQERQGLLNSRKLIRGTIRGVFNERPSLYFSDEAKNILEFAESVDRKTKPRFMTQGSFVYNTINRPARPPVQQMDLDDGVYFPLNYVENQSNGNFQRASRVIREIVFDCVRDLCGRCDWEIKRENKCLRITLSKSAHIDLPIYSIPDNQFDTIKEFIDYAEKNRLDRFLSYEKSKNILLATDDGWIESDPRVIKEWVKKMKEDLGNNFIYYSRYLKAWKDYQWDESKFSSIMIMSGVAQALSEYGYQKNDNVALDLSLIVRSITTYLSNGGIKNPADESRLDTNIENLGDLLRKLNTLATNLSRATKENQVSLLVDSFGGRFPSDPGHTSNVVPSVTSAKPIISSKPIRQSKCY